MIRSVQQHRRNEPQEVGPSPAESPTWSISPPNTTGHSQHGNQESEAQDETAKGTQQSPEKIAYHHPVCTQIPSNRGTKLSQEGLAQIERAL